MPFTSLPNLHPAVVHFPLALLPIALALDLASFLWSRRLWIDRGAAALYALGTLGAGAAYLAGEAAEDGLGRLPPPATLLVAEHADWARLTLWTFVGISAARFVLAWRARPDGPRLLRVARAALFAAAACGTWFLFETADRGGALVYRHGVAVALPREQEARRGGFAEGAAGDAGLRRASDGSLVWRPLPGDETAFLTIVRAVRGGPRTFTVVPDQGAGAEGLGLRISGLTLLVLPGRFEDVQVESRFDVSGYQGAVGLAHDVRDDGDGGIFQISTAGQAALIRISGGSSRTLAAGSGRLPRGVVNLTASAAGSHLKGMLDGALLVHGHASRREQGQVGLFFDGSGTVRVLEVRVTPLVRP